MLGIDIAIWLAFALSLASTVLCVVYGLARWNLDDDSVPEANSGRGTRHQEVAREDDRPLGP